MCTVEKIARNLLALSDRKAVSPPDWGGTVEHMRDHKEVNYHQHKASGLRLSRYLSHRWLIDNSLPVSRFRGGGRLARFSSLSPSGFTSVRSRIERLFHRKLSYPIVKEQTTIRKRKGGLHHGCG